MKPNLATGHSGTWWFVEFGSLTNFRLDPFPSLVRRELDALVSNLGSSHLDNVAELQRGRRERHATASQQTIDLGRASEHSKTWRS
jgi:hypothetical protein